MKNFSTIVICLVSMNTYCQLVVVDTSAIEFKAKLLTTSRFGLAESDSLLTDILGQTVTFLNSPSSNTLLIRIDFNQKYFKGKSNDQVLWLGSCSYYLAFNVKRNKYYRLGGFDVLDVDDFFQDQEPVDEALMNIEFSKVSEIDFYCLKAYSRASKKKRLKLMTCHERCSEVLETELVISQKEKQK